MTRFENSFTKKYSAQLESFDEGEFRELEQLKELFEFLDSVESEGEEIAIEAGVSRKR
jgi:condensin complex subunit 3